MTSRARRPCTISVHRCSAALLFQCSRGYRILLYGLSVFFLTYLLLQSEPCDYSILPPVGLRS